MVYLKAIQKITPMVFLRREPSIKTVSKNLMEASSPLVPLDPPMVLAQHLTLGANFGNVTSLRYSLKPARKD